MRASPRQTGPISGRDGGLFVRRIRGMGVRIDNQPVTAGRGLVSQDRSSGGSRAQRLICVTRTSTTFPHFDPTTWSTSTSQAATDEVAFAEAAGPLSA
jgi:hypothetical protein